MAFSAADWDRLWNSCKNQNAAAADLVQEMGDLSMNNDVFTPEAVALIDKARNRADGNHAKHDLLKALMIVRRQMPGRPGSAPALPLPPPGYAAGGRRRSRRRHTRRRKTYRYSRR